MYALKRSIIVKDYGIAYKKFRLLSTMQLRISYLSNVVCFSEGWCFYTRKKTVPEIEVYSAS